VERASLAGGRAGLAVFYAYLAIARRSKSDRSAAFRFLDQARVALGSVTMPPSLHSGFTGVAWAMEHLERRLGASDGDEARAAVDGALLDLLGRSPWRHDYDLMNGLVGFGVYALERLPRRAAAACLRRVVDRLEETAERGPRGTSWLTRPELLSPTQLAQVPHGYYNLGLAHGVPAVIALLGSAYAAGVARRKTRALLGGAVAWLDAQRLPAGAGSVFPVMVQPGVAPPASRPGWCYGDTGIAAALLLAARCVGQPAWERRALDIALRAAERPPEECGVVDACLCHGAAGIGHLFNRMFQATGEERLGEAARRWLGRALELRRPGRAIAGFPTRDRGGDGAMTWVAEPGLLTGAAGVALALLAATTPIEPSWDRMLLVNVSAPVADGRPQQP